VSVVNGYAHGSSGDFKALVAQDFARFVNHFLFLFGVTVVEEYVDMRQNVAENGLGELLGRGAFDAVLKVGITQHARTADRLIGGVNYSLNAVFPV